MSSFFSLIEPANKITIVCGLWDMSSLNTSEHAPDFEGQSGKTRFQDRMIMITLRLFQRGSQGSLALFLASKRWPQTSNKATSGSHAHFACIESTCQSAAAVP